MLRKWMPGSECLWGLWHDRHTCYSCVHPDAARDCISFWTTLRSSLSLMATHKVHQHMNAFSSEREVLVHATTFEPAQNSKCFLDYKTVRNHCANLIQSFWKTTCSELQISRDRGFTIIFVKLFCRLIFIKLMPLSLTFSSFSVHLLHLVMSLSVQLKNP